MSETSVMANTTIASTVHAVAYTFRQTAIASIIGAHGHVVDTVTVKSILHVVLEAFLCGKNSQHECKQQFLMGFQIQSPVQ